ncbi:uncharacterized protein LOC111062959 isoform X2 [Nilaparvata lugens]|uniref:uncharacterized protein LOC111062959 isoform X2 n=1 Tax=Nilaparvata lugens TaxID=108931 RepID=UPI00193CFB3E|nr:uncharacterized protein LOC111062959 isoform X2 [Nilaparvata lugens]
MEKVNRGLLQYLNLDIVTIFETVERQICDEFGPTRQLLEWLLVRLQGFAKLFDFIQLRCEETVSYLRWRFESGHVWIHALIATGILSRIWAISQALVRESCNWYRLIVKYLPTLQPSMTPWLPDSYILPDDLAKWLGQPSYIQREKPGEIGLDDVKANDKPQKSNASSTVITEDLGVAISREKFDSGTVAVELNHKKKKRNNRHKPKKKRE